MVKLKIWISNSIILLFFISIFSYTAPENYYDPEFFVDEFSASFNEKSINDYFNKNNVVLVSGGCYNVEMLFINDFIKFNIPITKKLHFVYDNIHYNTYLFDLNFNGYGLDYNFNKTFSLGFFANPTHYKKESDFSVFMNFNGFNTKNTFLVMLENFDNNYSNKNKIALIDEPRVYTYPDYGIGEFTQFPINIVYTASGSIKSISFYSLFIDKLKRQSDYFDFDSTYIYKYTTDSLSVYSYTKANLRFNVKEYNANMGLISKIIRMQNTYFDSINYTFEDDRTVEFGTFINMSNKHWEYGLHYNIGERNIKDSIDLIYTIRYYLLYPYIVFSKNKWSIEAGEIINFYKSADIDSLINDQMETRLLLDVNYAFNANTRLHIKKGMETDKKDIENGGKFFFYDKMYVQFTMIFDNIFKEQ